MTQLRSLLFVPADSERKLARAADTGADALILDLEDSVLPARKALARALARDYLRDHAGSIPLWIRINDLASGEALHDLAAVLPARPAGIVLPKIRGPEDVHTTSHYLDALETAHGIEFGSTHILALITETPVAVLRMNELVTSRMPRLTAVGWGAEDLSAALGAVDPRLPSGAWRPVYEHARCQCVLAAHSLGVDAIDTVYVDYRSTEGLRLSSATARADGFTGRFAIHPDQVSVINQAFTPTPVELDAARRIVAAFDAGVGAVSIEGKMYDIPHLEAARRTLRRADQLRHEVLNRQGGERLGSGE